MVDRFVTPDSAGRGGAMPGTPAPGPSGVIRERGLGRPALPTTTALSPVVTRTFH